MAKTANRAKASSTSGAKAMSLHIGLNSVDAGHYGGWGGELCACEFDANDMSAIATKAGMKAKLLLSKQAKRDAVLDGIRGAAGALKAGDLFFLSYSGHGGQVADVTGDEPDKKDETWCLYDGQLIDDELYFELGRFESGVRVLVVSDSCHSGTVTRAAMQPTSEPVTVSGQHWRSKMMPPGVALRTYREHQAMYDKLQEDVAKKAGKEGEVDPDSMLSRVAVSPRLTALVKAFRPAVILISGCQDNQTSMDGDHNGAFTEQLLQVWDNGTYVHPHNTKAVRNYATFHTAIRARMPASQSPNLFTLGDVSAFLREKPFAV
jgi:hypothetical protein